MNCQNVPNYPLLRYRSKNPLPIPFHKFPGCSGDRLNPWNRFWSCQKKPCSLEQPSESQNPDKNNSSSTQTQLKYWRVQSTNDTPIGKLSQRTIRNIFISLWVIQENPVFFLQNFRRNRQVLIEIFRGSSRGFFGRSIWFSVGFWRIFVGFDCSWTGLEWKIDESFRGLGFFSSGWIEQSRSTQLGSKGQFSEAEENETCPGIFFCWFSKVAGILGAFCPGGFESPPALLPPGFDAIIFFLLGWTAAMKLRRIPATFKDPANPSTFTHKLLLSRRRNSPKSLETSSQKIEWKNLLWPLNIFMIHRSKNER